MAFPTIPDHLLKKIEELKPAEKVKQKMISASSSVKSGTFTLTDSLVLLTISFLYFSFTGFALLIGRKLPPKWLQIGHDLNAGRVAEKINQKKKEAEVKKTKRPAKYKVVDLETKKPVGVKVEPMRPAKS